jgi:zinc protease
MIKKIYSNLFSNGLEYYYIRKKASFNMIIEVWVKVGSCNEMPHEYGICHMIEHMIFKGSEKIELGVLDTLFYMMSGKTNAYTSKDFTVYTFSVPKDYFNSLVSILFDLFDEPRFDESDLITEKEVVIQEIQMYEDDSYSKLFDEAFANSASRYNYQHEILGTKKTVQSFSEKQLYDFYKKYYIPGNMKFFIMGDLPYKQVALIMEKSKFSEIKSSNIMSIAAPLCDTKTKKINYFYTETLNKHFLLTYLFPVCSYDKINIFKGLNLLLGGGKDSLLYEKLHIELKLVSDIRSFFHGLNNETYYFIYFNPIEFKDLSLIITHIYAVIDSIIANAFDLKKIEKINNILEFQHAMLLSENADDFIAQYAPYAFEKKRNFLICKHIPLDLLQNKITKLASFFKHKKSILNAILPYNCDQSNKIKNLIINNVGKESGPHSYDDITEKKSIDCVEHKSGFLINLLELKKEKKEILEKIKASQLLIKKSHFPKFVPFCPYKEIIFDNNLKVVLINDNENSELVSLVLSLKVKHYHDEKKYEGGIAFLFDWLYEGTLNFKGTKFIETIEKYGIEFEVNIGVVEIKCLKKYINIAIHLLSDFLCNPEFSIERFNLLKIQTIDSIKNFMDDASSVGLQKIRELVYLNHPYGKNPSGSIESISLLTPEVVKKLYYEYISPDDALLFIVGEIEEEEVKKLIRLYLASWQYKKIESFLLPSILNYNNNNCHDITYMNIDKDQAVILYGGLSVKKYSDEFYYLLLADQLLGGTITDSMHALLFQIRDKSGMFYDISGSLVSGCSLDRGMIIIKAMTDKSNVNRAMQNINNVIDNFISFITDEDLFIAKKSLLLAMAEKNTSKSSVLNSFLNKYRYDLTIEDLKKHYDVIKKASVSDIKKALGCYFNRSRLQILIVQNNT